MCLSADLLRLEKLAKAWKGLHASSSCDIGKKKPLHMPTYSLAYLPVYPTCAFLLTNIFIYTSVRKIFYLTSQ